MPIKRPRLLTLQAGCGSTNPADSTLYYFGVNAGVAMFAAEGSLQLTVPYTGKIIHVHVHSFAATTTGTNEAWEYFLRNSTTTTDYTLGTVSAAAANRKWTLENANIPVTKGDLLIFKTTTPAWVTNPEGVRMVAYVILQRP